MEVEKQEEQKEEVIVPNVIGMTVKEAKKTLEELGLGIKINQNEEIDEQLAIITEQTPKAGIIQEKDRYIVCDIN